MKKILISLAAIALVFASCSKDNDPKIIGDFSISGQAATGAGRFSTWIPEDSLGVFVTSKGKTQENLLYFPSEHASYNEDYISRAGYYAIADGTSVGDVLLRPATEAAGFKKGTHTIYAYYPYNAAADNINAIPVPDNSVQDKTQITQKFFGQVSYKWVFGYAKKSVSEYSAATVDLGQFKSPVTMFNTGGLPFTADAKDRTIVKLNIAANGTIAYKNAAFDLESEKYVGDAVDNIDYICDITINVMSFGSFSFVNVDPAIFVVDTDLETAKGYTFTFTATMDNGDVYTATAPAKQNSMKDAGTGETIVLDYLNIDWGDVTFQKK